MIDVTKISHKDAMSLLDNLYKNNIEPIFFFDAQGLIIDMNAAAENIINPEDLALIQADDENQPFCFTCRGYTSDKELMSCNNCFMSNTHAKFSSFQVYLNTRDKGIIPFSASFQTIDPITGTRVLMLRDLTSQLVTQEMMYRNTMMKNTIKAQEDERKRISRELHDSVAQELLSSLVDLRVMKYLNISDDVMQKLEQTEGSLTRLLDQIRNLSVELRPSSLDDLGLEAAFRSHFKWIEKNYGVIVQFKSELHGTRYNSEIETVFYRICQESILNAIKYADVDEIAVSLFETKDFLELIVEDKGSGFNMNMRDPKGTGLGLYGMRERAELVSGNLSISSQLGSGTKIHLQIPTSIARYDKNN